MPHSEINEKTQVQEMQERREKVSHLILQGYTEVGIAEELGVSRETIVRDVKYLKSTATPWFKGLAVDGFAFEYMVAHDKLKENERGYRKMLERETLSVSEEIKIRKAIDENIAQQLNLLAEGPTLESLNKIVRDHGINLNN